MSLHSPAIRKWVDYALDMRMNEADVAAALLFLQKTKLMRDMERVPVALRACDYAPEKIAEIMADLRGRLDSLIWPP